MAPRRAPASLLGAAAAAVVLLAGACTDGGDGVAEPDPGSTTSTVPERPLRLGIGRVPSLDPALASPDSPSASITVDLLYDGLTELLPGEPTATPALAESWDTADGGRSWTFALDPDATFSDGSPVTADDVARSLGLVAAQGQVSLTASRLDVVVGVEAVDAATVRIALGRPVPWLPELLAAPAYGIVGPSAGVTSGPYRIDPGAEAGGAANPDVLVLTPAAGRSTDHDAIALHQFDDLGLAVERVAAGDLDWSLAPPADAEVVAPFQAELFFGFNLADPMFADVRFRQAVAQAVDRQAIVDAVYPEVAVVLTGVVPAGVPGADPARCRAGCAHDPTAALALLAQAFPGGGVPEVPIDHPDGADETAVAALLEQQLEAVGIPAVLRSHPAAEYSSFVLSGAQGLASLGWIGVAATPADYLDRLFRTGSPDNLTGFTDPALDALLDAGTSTGDAEALVLAAAPIVAIAQFTTLAVVGDTAPDLRLDVTGTLNVR